MNTALIVRFCLHLLSIACAAAAIAVFDNWLRRVAPELSSVFLATTAAVIAHLIASNISEKETEAK